jgi:GxxExxY protein
MLGWTEEDYNKITSLIIESAIEVHKELGPGLMESVYEVCLMSIMREKGLKVQRQVILPVVFKGEELDKTFIIDILVNDVVVLELNRLKVFYQSMKLNW